MWNRKAPKTLKVEHGGYGRKHEVKNGEKK